MSINWNPNFTEIARWARVGAGIVGSISGFAVMTGVAVPQAVMEWSVILFGVFSSLKDITKPGVK